MAVDKGMSRDQRLLRNWWASLMNAAGPARHVVALWFGLVQLVWDGEPRWELYVIGCSSFDPSERSGDWRANVVWIPPDRYLHLPGLDELADRPYEEMLEYARTLIVELTPQQTWLGEPLHGVAVGFDDGDFEVIFVE